MTNPIDRVREAVEAALPDARIEVASAMPGHFELRVVSRAFAGKSLVEQHQLVYRALAPLMEGPNAPVHAIDALRTECPSDTL